MSSGKAVRKGSGSLGGRKYQVIAVLLTYFSLASTAAPPITKYLFEEGAKAHSAAGSKSPQDNPQAKGPVNPVAAIAAFVVFVFGLARLTELAGEASAAESATDWTRALTAWREAILLLPEGSRQRASATAFPSSLPYCSPYAPAASPMTRASMTTGQVSPSSPDSSSLSACCV